MKRTITLLAVVIAVAGIIAGCDALKGGGSGFSHKKHVTDEGIDCATCHNTATTSGVPSMPDLKACMECHEATDKEKPEKERVATRFFKDGKPTWAKHVQLSADVVFAHKSHVDRKADCASCHAGIKESVRTDKGLAPTMATCVACHTKEQENCGYCHKEIRKDRAPKSHAGNWAQMHGVQGRDGVSMSKSCAACHEESACMECHQNRKPKDHNATWRHETHGVMAGADRSRCMTCHQVDYCQRCHEETAPRSHRGNWGAPTDNHCMTCHFPVSGGNQACALCHKSTPSHQEATPKPAWHATNMNCRQCHGNGVELPHVDKGDSCNGCHN